MVRFPLLVALLLLSASTTTVGAAATTRLVDHRVEGAGWTSFIVDFTGPGRLDISTKNETAPMTQLQRGREAPASSAIWVEWLRTDGTWQVVGGFQTGGCAREAHRALVRAEGDVPPGLMVDAPAGAHPFQGGAHTGLGVTWTFASTFRVTTFGAGHDPGAFWTTADGTSEVSVATLNTGSHVGYLTSDDDPRLGAYAQANQFSASLRTGGRIDFPVENRIYTAIFVSVAPDVLNYADYRGPVPGWNGIRAAEAEVFDGPPGDYSVEPLATLNLGWRNVISGLLDGQASECPASWLLADVDPPQVPDIWPPTAASVQVSPTNTSQRDVLACYSAIDAQSGVAEVRSGEDIASALWRTYSPGMCEEWTMGAGDGWKTLRAQFRDAVGNVAPVVTDSILLDTIAPHLKDMSPLGIVPFAPAPTVRAGWEDDTSVGPGTGIWYQKSRVWWTDRNAGQTIEITGLPTYKPTASGFSYNPGALSPGNEYTILVGFQDGAGNLALDGWSFTT